MKKVIFIAVALSQLFFLTACGSWNIERMNRRDEARTKVVESQANGIDSAQWYYYKSLGSTYNQIAKGQVKTDGEGLYVIIDNENRDNANTIVVGPIPVTGVVSLGMVPKNLALALFQGGQYAHRSYYIQGDRYGEDYYEEDYLPPGKYISFSYVQGRLQGNGWCFEVTAQLHPFKGKKVHGYTICHQKL